MKKILIVEDDQGILEALTILLEAEGFAVVSQTNGKKLLNTIKVETPDLILLDMLLSGDDGRLLSQKLKLETQTKNIPIIMISASPNLSRDTKKYLADDYLQKPFEIEELLEKIQLYLSR